MNKKEIIRIGKIVRREIKKLAKRKRAIDDHTLEGACAVSSCVLHYILSEQGIKSTVYCGLYYPPQALSFTWRKGPFVHCWLELHLDGEDFIFDITTTQFNKYHHEKSFKHDVVMITIEEGKYSWRGAEKVPTCSWCRLENYFSSWPEDHQPNRSNIESIVTGLKSIVCNT